MNSTPQIRPKNPINPILISRTMKLPLLSYLRRLLPPPPTPNSQSHFFRNIPDCLIDFDPNSTSDSPSLGKKRSSNLKDSEKLNDETDSSSAITSLSGSQIVNDDSTTVDSPNSGPDFLFMLLELIIEIISFQTKLLAKSVKSSIWLIHSSYMLLNNPYRVIRHVQGGINGICYNSGVKLITWFQTHESALKLCVRIGWGLLWLVYRGFILVCLLVPAFVFGGIVVKWIVEEPVQITEQLGFDYTEDTPMAFVPIISCLESSLLVHKQTSKVGSFDESRVVPFDHELKAIVSLVLPEVEYNRHLGIFQLRVDFLSSDGKLLASTSVAIPK